MHSALKNACLVLSLILTPAAAAADLFVAPRPAGTTGDGTKANPFNDPWRALVAASSGDTIHVAEGTYFGRFDRSNWVVDRPNLTILGGYSADFAERNPWRRPTVLAHFSSY